VAAWALWTLTMLGIAVIAWLDQLSRQAGRPELAQLTYQSHGTNCSQGRERGATGGIITHTSVTDTLVEGSYDLQFRRDRVQGSFSAPMCLLCTPRPTARACLDQPV
jgi:hypothetical protein